MIVKTKPFQWPLTSLHSKVKPKPFTKLKFLGWPSFSFGLYLCYDMRNATNVHEICRSLFSFSRSCSSLQLLYANKCALFFFFCRLSQYISLHHTSSDSETKSCLEVGFYVHAMTWVNQILYAKFDWPQMYMVDVYFYFFSINGTWAPPKIF